jgi:hypothetical protein
MPSDTTPDQAHVVAQHAPVHDDGLPAACARSGPTTADRIRRIAGGFAFVPNDFLHHGFFAPLSHAERSLYFFLVLAGDRVSFYTYDRICDTLELTPDEYLLVRNRLVDNDLIAFDGRRFQVLSLPPAPIAPAPRPLVTQEDLEDHDPATVRHIIKSSLDRCG